MEHRKIQKLAPVALRIVKELLPEIPGPISIANSGDKKCVVLSTAENDEDFYFSLCLLFEDKGRIVPSLICNIGRDEKLIPEAGKCFRLEDLTGGIERYIKKQKLKSFLRKNKPMKAPA